MSETGDMSKIFRGMKERRKNIKATNKENASKDQRWKKHTDYHWSMIINNSKLDYWCSTRTYMYKSKVMCGDVDKFIKKQKDKQ